MVTRPHTPLFYYDIVCPYAYMAFTLLHRQGLFERRALVLKPILLGGLFKLMEQQANPLSSMSEERARFVRNDIMRQAQFYEVPLNFNPRHPRSTLGAMRMLMSCPEEQRASLSQSFYKAYWQDQQDIEDEACLKACSKAAGVELQGHDQNRVKELLIEATKEAFNQKVFGVPSIVTDERLYFGSDRLVLLKEQLKLSLPDEEWTPGKTSIDFYFDFASPYSYLAYGEMRKAEACGVHINYIPILLGALFKERGIADVPMLAAHPHKASYYLQDMKDWAKARSLDFTFNSAFPLRSVNALRLSLVAPELKTLIFEAAWAQDQDIGNPEFLLAILKKAGLSPVLLEEAQSQQIKDKLKNNTDQALKQGVFGVPSFSIGSELVFGQDRFPWLKAKLKSLQDPSDTIF